jgi:hypothetical protein
LGRHAAGHATGVQAADMVTHVSNLINLGIDLFTTYIPSGGAATEIAKIFQLAEPRVRRSQSAF